MASDYLIYINNEGYQMIDLNNINLIGDDKKQNVYFITGENGTGKSRLLEKIIDKLKKDKGANSYNNIIAFSGTFFDRLPVKDFIVKKKNGELKYIYFGVKTNSNIASRLTPIKKFISEIINFYKLSHENKDQENTTKSILNTISKILHQIGFDDRIHIEVNVIEETGGFTKSGKRQTKSINKEYLDFSLSAFGGSDVDSLINIFHSKDVKKLNNFNKTVENIAFYKINNNEKLYFQMGKSKNKHMLSSGEILYITMILGLGYGLCQAEKSLIVYDEPENSMHPEWQISIIPTMLDIINEANNLNTTSKLPDIIIATHSPLISSSVQKNKERDVYTAILSKDKDSFTWETSEYFGENVDSVLTDLFGMLSPRSENFRELLQLCIDHYVDNNLSMSKVYFDQIKNVNLKTNDPLYKIFNILKQSFNS